MKQRCPLPARLRPSVLVLLRTVMLGAALLPGTVQAQNSPRDPVGAEDLFRRAMQQLEAGDWAGACERFQKSMDLEPSVSTLAKIAKCREHEGKLATAWYEYQRALKLALGTDMADRRRRELEEHIQARVADLEPRIPKLRITVEPAPPGLEVLRNGTAVALSALGEPLPVDPGEHEIVARAPGFLPQKLMVVVEESSSAEAKLRLTAEPLTARTKPAPAANPPQKTPFNPARRPSSDSTARAASPDSQTQTGGNSLNLDWSGAGFVLGGVGLATLAAAGYFGLDAVSLVNDSDPHCSDDGRCDQEGVRLRRDASDAQTNALLLTGAGALSLGLGAVLVFASSEPHPTSHQASLPRLEARVGPTFVLARGLW